MTRFANPTKVLEYMAAGLALVSTDLADVRSQHSAHVRIATDHAAFIHACEMTLARSPDTRQRDASAMRTAASRLDWNRSAKRIAGLLTDLLGASTRAA